MQLEKKRKNSLKNLTFDVRSLIIIKLFFLGQADHKDALVAQLDRVSDYESEGRGFESLRARQKRGCCKTKVLRQSLSQVKKASKAVIQAESRREGAKNGVTKQSSAAERRIKFPRFQFFRKLFFFDTE